MIKTTGVLHHTVPVSDTVVSKKFYEDVLGFTTIQHVPQIDMVFMRCGEDFVIIITYLLIREAICHFL